MTGLNLESFLHLLRADLGAWATLGLIAVVLALMAWTSWGSRRALRKCLVLSIVAHFGLALYGGTIPGISRALQPDAADDADDEPERIRRIVVVPTPDDTDPDAIPGAGAGASATASNGGGGGGIEGGAGWDRPLDGLALADARLSVPRTSMTPDVAARPGARVPLEPESTAPRSEAPELSAPDARPDPPVLNDPAPPPAARAAAVGEDEVAPAVVARAGPISDAIPEARLRPERVPPADASATTEPRRPANLAELAETPAPAPAPAFDPVAPPDPVAPRREASGVAAVASPPLVASAVGPKDVPPAEVVAARPAAPRLSPGADNLRARARPDAGVVAEAPARPSLAPAVPTIPALEGPIPAPSPRPGGLATDATTPEADGSARPRPIQGDMAAAADVVKEPVAPLPPVALPEGDVRRRSRPSSLGPKNAGDRRPPASSGPLALARVTPTGAPALPEIRGATGGGRPLADVPEVYRSRLDPNRSAHAFRAGASPASEQAVERALDWLSRHQDADGRWDGAVARLDDGSIVAGDDDFTVHCPPGETCFGPCFYYEADTALTGLALLAYLGAGYTQSDGKYAETVARGIDFLLAGQRPDGDLRGQSRAVGMYCHAMATIALCEAFALTGDERLRAPVERALGFLVRSRARDGLVWRYAPGADGRPADAVGDTSLLGWAVMALKSGREVGIPIPRGVQSGILAWLSRVSSGDLRGLARYQPGKRVDPTMTAEAWVCRQFLGVGGPGSSSSEAARYLLDNAPRAGNYNLYYWYYGTLAMYQHGGEAWTRWNARARDEITRRQIDRGHSAGSWAPDPSEYGAMGGRIYATALATLSLEVYYRFLRLYDEPQLPPALAPRPRPVGGDRDPALGRLSSPSVPTAPAPLRPDDGRKR